MAYLDKMGPVGSPHMVCSRVRQPLMVSPLRDTYYSRFSGLLPRLAIPGIAYIETHIFARPTVRMGSHITSRRGIHFILSLSALRSKTA